MTDPVQLRWTAESVLTFLSDHRDELLRLGVNRIGLFGSYVRGEEHTESDMDFLFAMQNMTFASWMDLWNFLEDSFGCTVDLVPEKDLRPELRSRILAEVQYVEGL